MAPWLLAIAAAARPTEVVPPRISDRSPFRDGALEQRTPCGLQHFRNRSECFPWKFSFNGLNLHGGHAGIFCVAAVERSTHAAHYGRDDFASAEFVRRRLLNQSNGFDAKDPGERYVWRMTLASE